MADTLIYSSTETHIIATSDMAGGKPRIAGTRIRVQDVYIWHEHHGMSADDIAREYQLSLAQVYAALSYAFDHLETIRTAIQQSEATADEIQQHYPSKLAKHLKDNHE